MERYELDAVLERNLPAVLRKTLPPPPSDSLATLSHSNKNAAKKQVQFSESVEVQWPEAAERLRTEAIRFMARRKAEREARLVALVYREEGRDKGKSQEDPKHPHFPFPPDFKPIDFEHLDPYKLYEAAEYLRQEQRRIAEPFLIHAKKIKSLGRRAESEWRKEEERIEALPIQHRKKIRPPPMVSIVPSNVPLTTRRTSSLATYSKKSVRMNSAGGRMRAEPGFKGRGLQVTPHLRAPSENLAMRNVAVWLKSNFLIKPIPLILHPPKLLMGGPMPSLAGNVPPPSPSGYALFQRPSPTQPREVHVLNGLVMPRNVFNDTVGNCFAEDYDSSRKDSAEKPNWTPHRFRCTVNMGKFQDHEISFFFKRPFLTVKGERARSVKRMGERAEETIEVPDWLQLQNLKMFRLRDGKIVIEEGGVRRKTPPSPRTQTPGFQGIKT